MAKSPKPPKRAGLSGVLVLDKPTGPTSFDVVAQVRRRYRVRSVGHAGTLDPLASGVLVVMLGEATKLSEYLTAADKHYRAEITFGRSTDTFDVLGQTVDQRAILPGEVTEARLYAALDAERTRRLQAPPAFSAIKQEGETAYKRARRGETVELAARPVRVASLTLEALTDVTARLDIRASKGYYVRSLARDVSECLGVPGCLSGLRRLASGAFTLAQASAWPPATDELPPLVSVSSAAKQALPHGTLTPEGVIRARQGKRLTAAHFSVVPEGAPAAWLCELDQLVAIGEPVTEVEAEAESPPPSDGRGFRVLRGFQADAII